MLKLLRDKERLINSDIDSLISYPGIAQAKSQSRLPLIPKNMRLSSQSKRYEYFEPSQSEIKNSHIEFTDVERRRNLD
jgi:hypothetical protein